MFILVGAGFKNSLKLMSNPQQDVKKNIKLKFENQSS